MKGYKNVGAPKLSRPPLDRSRNRQDKFLRAQQQSSRSNKAKLSDIRMKDINSVQQSAT